MGRTELQNLFCFFNERITKDVQCCVSPLSSLLSVLTFSPLISSQRRGLAPNPTSFLFLDEKKRKQRKIKKILSLLALAFAGPGQIFTLRAFHTISVLKVSCSHYSSLS
ncbi:hypothetical protein, partial [Maribellus maritimus]|uniref:hypothetical protein n=1 Tax=Maribellus maritimus TaxID=2870838 RepID=UPI001EEA5110